MNKTSYTLFEVTVNGILVCGDGETLPASGEFEAAVERLANSLYAKVEDATVASQRSTGEVKLWFSRLSENNPHSDLKWAMDVLDEILDRAGIALPAMPDSRDKARGHLPTFGRWNKPQLKPIAAFKSISHTTQTVQVAALA